MAVLVASMLSVANLPSLASMISRVIAGLELLACAQDLVAKLIERDRISAESAQTILREIPRLQDDLRRQSDAIKEAVDSLEDRVTIVAQFLLLHRTFLSNDEISKIERLLREVRGENVAGE